MKARNLALTAALAAGTLLPLALAAQRPPFPVPRGGNRANPQANRPPQAQAEPRRDLPQDARLLKLYQEFITAAEKLAEEYEAQKDLDKAKAVYQEIRALVPQYEPAKKKLDAIRQAEETANSHTCEVRANRSWQYSGIRLQKGKPIKIQASGVWTVKFEATVGPDGVVLPEDQRQYRLGCLVGAIETNQAAQEMKPFLIGTETSITAPESGRLMLRIFDANPANNSGSLKVQFLGTFLKD